MSPTTSGRVPAAAAAAALVAGVVCAASVPGWPSAAVAAPAALALAVPCIVNTVHTRRRRGVVHVDALLICALILSGGASYASRHGRVRPDDAARFAHLGTIALEGTVVESRVSASGSRRVVVRCRSIRTDGGDGSRVGASGLVWLAWPPDRALPGLGDIVRARGPLTAARGRRNPAGFDFRRYLRDRGVHAILQVERAEVETRGRAPERVGRWIRSRIRERLSPSAAELLLGLLLGETGGIPPDVLAALRRTGTVHVTAVSGLHVGFIVVIAYTVLRALRAPPRPARLLVLPVLAGFVSIVGPRASVLRASAMAACLIVSASLERRVHPLNSLGVAAVVLVAIRPGAVFDLGFQLSFAAATGITVLFEPIRTAFRRRVGRLGRAGEAIADALSVSLSAQAGVAPILVSLFGELSVVAPLANLAVVPAAAFSVASGIAMLGAEVLVPPLAPVFAASADGALWLMTRVVVFLGARPWAAAPVPAASWPSFLVAALGLALAARLRGPLRRRVGALTLAACLGLACATNLIGPGRSYPRVIFFDVGQGDAALLEIPRRRYVLVDAGVGGRDGWSRDAGRDVVLPYLKRNAIRRLEAAVVTHGHRDHAGGMAAVLGHAAVGELIVPAGGGLDPGLGGLCDAARRAGTRVREVARGDTLLLAGRSSVIVLGPPADWGRGGPTENDRSIVLLARLGDARVLLTGDIEGRGERRLLSPGGCLVADVLKLPHHGSSSSSTPAFLDAVAARLAVCSVGEGNRHGHPDRRALERVRDRGAEVLRTDRDGAVLTSVRGGTIRSAAIASGRSVTLRCRSRRPARGPQRVGWAAGPRPYAEGGRRRGPTRTVAE